jgi:AcrR family transcriptional regulator
MKSQQKLSKKAESIIESTIKLLKEYELDEISMTQIAEISGATRTSIYKIFPTSMAIFEEIAKRIADESYRYITEFAKSNNPQTYYAVVDATIEGTCEFYSNHPEAEKTILGKHTNLHPQSIVPNFDALCSRMYLEIADVTWPFEFNSAIDPLPYFTLIQSSLYSSSIQQHGHITSDCAQLSKFIGRALIDNAANKQLQIDKNQVPDQRSILLDKFDGAISTIRDSAGLELLNLACDQLESIVNYMNKKK